MFNNVKRKIVHEDDNFIARVEEVTLKGIKVIFIHIEVKQMKKVVIDYLKEQFPKFKIKVRDAGYDNLFTYSRTPRFYKFFPGYEEVGDMNWEGETYKVLKWELNS